MEKYKSFYSVELNLLVVVVVYFNGLCSDSASMSRCTASCDRVIGDKEWEIMW
jgi:hypothetical protein